MRVKERYERGQALVIIILAIVLIFGFAALAVDVGRLYAERRRAQNAADAAAYAAAFTSTMGGNYQTVGLESANTNGFVDADAGASLDPAIRTDVQIYHPPISGRYSVPSETVNPNEYYQVIIYNQVDMVFSQFVYDRSLSVTVEAIARGRGQRAFAAGHAIVATCENCCDALRFHGTADVLVTGGNIVSNSVVTGCDAGTREGQPCLEVVGGEVNLGGTLDEGYPTCRNSDHVIVPGIQGPVHENSGDLWQGVAPGTPGCTGLPTVTRGTYANVGSAGNPYQLTPGIYSNGISITGNRSSVRLAPGMYCLDGDLSVTSGTLAGADVMFVMRGSSSVNISTSYPVTLSAPAGANSIPDDTIYPGYRWSGFLIFMPYSNDGQVNLAGGNTTNYTGTIYAPGPPRQNNSYKCSILGNSDTLGLNASLICYTVQVGGTGGININYMDDSNAQSPPMIELTK